MIRRCPAGRADHVAVEFVLSAEGHELPVALAGDFNAWDVDALGMAEDGEGTLRASIELPAGQRYEFRYRDARGRWFNDDAADDYVRNEWGGMNGVVAT